VTDVSNHKLVTFVEVACNNNCKGIQEKFYKWTIEPKPKSAQFSFDYKKNSRNGRTGFKFIIERNALKPGNYTITVELKSDMGHHGFASINLEYGAPANVKECKIKPESGDTLSTDYQLKCIQDPPNEKNFYELFVKDKDGKLSA
jgi:hypothetical protein